jgi:hypothetical protein
MWKLFPVTVQEIFLTDLCHAIHITMTKENPCKSLLRIPELEGTQT